MGGGGRVSEKLRSSAVKFECPLGKIGKIQTYLQQYFIKVDKTEIIIRAVQCSKDPVGITSRYILLPSKIRKTSESASFNYILNQEH
jgi:hypothetical protein